MGAAGYGHLLVVELLLSSGADKDARGKVCVSLAGVLLLVASLTV